MIRSTELQETSLSSLARMMAGDDKADGVDAPDAERSAWFHAAFADQSANTLLQVKQDISVQSESDGDLKDDSDHSSDSLLALLQGQEAATWATATKPPEQPSISADQTLSTPETKGPLVTPLGLIPVPAAPAFAAEIRPAQMQGPAANAAPPEGATGTLPSNGQTPELTTPETSEKDAKPVEPSTSGKSEPSRSPSPVQDATRSILPRDGTIDIATKAAATSAPMAGVIQAAQDRPQTTTRSTDAARGTKIELRAQSLSRLSVSQQMEASAAKHPVATAVTETLRQLASEPVAAQPKEPDQSAAFAAFADQMADPGATAIDDTRTDTTPNVQKTFVVSTESATWEADMIDGIMARLTDEGGVIEISLTPENLGQVDVTVELRDGVADISFRTETREAARLFSQSESRLADLMQQNGLGFGGQDASSRQDAPGNRRQTPLQQQPSTMPTEPAFTPSAQSAGRLNLIA